MKSRHVRLKTWWRKPCRVVSAESTNKNNPSWWNVDTLALGPSFERSAESYRREGQQYKLV